MDYAPPGTPSLADQDDISIKTKFMSTTNFINIANRLLIQAVRGVRSLGALSVPPGGLRRERLLWISCQALTKVFSLNPKEISAPNLGTKPGWIWYSKNRGRKQKIPSQTRRLRACAGSRTPWSPTPPRPRPDMSLSRQRAAIDPRKAAESYTCAQVQRMHIDKGAINTLANPAA